MKKKKVTATIYITDTRKANLVALAEKEGVTVSALINSILLNSGVKK